METFNFNFVEYFTKKYCEKLFHIPYYAYTLNSNTIPLKLRALFFVMHYDRQPSSANLLVNPTSPLSVSLLSSHPRQPGIIHNAIAHTFNLSSNNLLPPLNISHLYRTTQRRTHPHIPSQTNIDFLLQRSKKPLPTHLLKPLRILLLLTLLHRLPPELEQRHSFMVRTRLLASEPLESSAFYPSPFCFGFCSRCMLLNGCWGFMGEGLILGRRGEGCDDTYLIALLQCLQT